MQGFEVEGEIRDAECVAGYRGTHAGACMGSWLGPESKVNFIGFGVVFAYSQS